jgi:peptide/nickel transport system substrate-binding protein
MSIAFHIDPAARFHDGVPVRSSDVRYSLKTINDPALASPNAQLLTNIDSISTPDSLTAKFWFKRHLPEEFYDVAYQIPIVPEHIYGKVKAADMSSSDVLRHPVGSGRFRLVKWDAGNRIEIVADTANYRGRAKLDRVIFDVNQAPPAAATAILTGESDFYEAFPVDQVPKLDSGATARGLPYTQMGYGFMGMRVRERKSKTRPHWLFSDKAVRRAISMSLDRSAMLANIFNGKGLPAHGPFPAGVATADTTIRLPPYDTSAAKALLDSAGWKVGPGGIRLKNGRALTFELMVPATSAIRGRFADLIQEQLKRVGIQAEIAKIPGPNFFARLDAGDFDAVLNTINTDPSVNGTKEYWATDGVTSGSNTLAYVNPKVDALLDSAGRAPTLTIARGFATRAYQTIVDDAPAVWLYNASTTAAVSRRIVTQSFRADGWWAHLADWSIPADKRIDRDRIGLTPKTP